MGRGAVKGSFQSWHLWIDEAPRPGWANMAIDTSLLERAERLGEGWLRLYRWNPSCLSFGRHEPATRRYDIHQIEALGLDTVRRPTGGRAVWHARELTYAVAAPSVRLGSLQSAYLEIHRMIAEALECLGATVSLAAPQAEQRQSTRGPALPNHPAGKSCAETQRSWAARSTGRETRCCNTAPSCWRMTSTW